MTDDEFYMQDGGEPSEYERMVEEKRMERLLKQQIKKYGEDAMRMEPSMAIDSSTMPVEDFQRSYQLRMPGVQHPKKRKRTRWRRYSRFVAVSVAGSASIGPRHRNRHKPRVDWCV